MIENSDTDVSLTAGWYVVNSDIIIKGNLNYTGNVNIILADGYSLKANTVSAPVYMNEFLVSKLVIYGQENDSGIFNVTNISGMLEIKGGTIHDE